MKSVGIICEYNPFHNGHLYHINKVKELFPDYTIVLVLGGNFTQRGDFSLLDKWTKTEIALNYVDLVIELPFVFATQSADIFAKGAISILKNLNVSALVFGSECDDINLLKSIVDLQETDKYNLLVKKYLDNGYNYPTSLSKAIYDLNKITIDKPNDLLGLEYIRNLKGTNIKGVTIKRTNDYHDDNLDNKISSATSIRKALLNGDDVKNFVPSYTYDKLDNLHFFDDYFDLLKYKIISDNDLSRYQTVDEGIENRLKKCINDSKNLDQFISNVKTKRYTYNKIQRMLLHILCGFTKEEARKFKNLEYIRVLGFNDKGKNYIKKVKEVCPLPIITNYSNKFDMLDLELRVSNIYNIKEKDDSFSEYKHKPIIF